MFSCTEQVVRGKVFLVIFILSLCFIFCSGLALADSEQSTINDAGVEQEAEVVVPSSQDVALNKTDADVKTTTSIIAPSIVYDIITPPTVDENVTLEAERKQDLEIMIRRTHDFESTVNSVISRVYKMRRDFIEDGYKTKIDDEEILEYEALKDAIIYFEDFLKKYTNDPPYTPDAMFRLAELYYDVSYIDYLDGLNAYSDAQDKGTEESMEVPEKEFDRSIALFQELVKRYPEYRNVDGAYYLLGYCLNETGKEEEARMSWLNLVCANKYHYDPISFAASKDKGLTISHRPSASLYTGEDELTDFMDPFAGCDPVADNSRFFFEAWWLIGNYHFDFDTTEYGVETAMSAYKKLVTDPTHRFYDKGLYKLAWSYFKADMYPEAIESFAKVVDFADDHGGKDLGMRPEAIQYLAFCFYTADWDGDMVDDYTSGIRRLQNSSLMPQDKAWTHEVYASLGDIYYDNQKQEEAIAVWKLFLEKWPLNLQAPFVQDKIASSYREQRAFDDELIARSKLDAFGPESEWWLANADHPDIQHKVANMAQEALINSAVTHHQQAQALRIKAKATGDMGIMAFALEEYNLAASAYRKYLEQNPETPDAYDLNSQLADALFWSGHYNEAKIEYVAVRDSNLDDRHREESAKMVIICLQRILDTEIIEGRIVIREEPPELVGEPPSPNPLPLPPLLLELMTERENFLKDEPSSPDAATFDYHIAQSYYRYGHWDEAKQRYAAIYGKYCKRDEVSIISWRTLLSIAGTQNDLDSREQLALMEQQNQCTVDGMPTDEDGIDLGDLLGDVAMQRAMSKFRECKENKDVAICSEAGDQLVAAVSKAPNHKSADGALYNAAFAYEIASRFETAMKLYGRIVDEYSQSSFVDKCLFKQAFSANKFFEYEIALGLYKILADEKRYKDSDFRIDAILNTAVILTNLQSYKEAIPYWQRYSKEVDDSDKAIEADFKAADMHFRAKSWFNAIDAFDKFIKRYERNTGAGRLVVKASYRISISEGNRNKKRRQIKSWENTVSYYKRLVNDSGSMSAEYAAESHFFLIEKEMDKFTNFSIKGSMKQIESKLNSGAEKVKNFEVRYREVQKYGRPEWSLAAEFRIGYAYEVYAKAILNIPPPPLDKELQKALKQLPKEDRDMVIMEYEDKFRDAMEKKVIPMEERAKEEYKIAIKLARQGNISNDWTLLALERMHAYDPDGYPRQHNGIVGLENNTVAVPPWAPEVQ